MVKLIVAATACAEANPEGEWGSAGILLLKPDRGCGRLNDRMRRRLSDRLKGSGETNRDLSLDETAVLLWVQQILVERGSLTYVDVRRIAGYTRDVTIADHPGDDMAPGTLNSVLRQAGMKE